MRPENGPKVSEVGAGASAFGRAFAELSPACENAHLAAELCVRNQIVEKLVNYPPARLEGLAPTRSTLNFAMFFLPVRSGLTSPAGVLSEAKIRLIYFRVNELEGLRVVRK